MSERKLGYRRRVLRPRPNLEREGHQVRSRVCYTSEMIHIQNSARHVLTHDAMPDRKAMFHSNVATDTSSTSEPFS